MMRFTVTGARELRARIGASRAALLRETIPEAVREITVVGAEQAKYLIGRENAWWTPLARRTVMEKRRLGYAGRLSPTDPLFRTGSMRESIKPIASGLTGLVASKDPVALWQEKGTKRGIPARSFLLSGLEIVARGRAQKMLAAAWRRAWG